MQQDLEANFGDPEQAKTEIMYKIGRTSLTIMYLVATVTFYIYENDIGFSPIVAAALKFFGKILGSALFNATYKDFAYANCKKRMDMGNPENQTLV